MMNRLEIKIDLTLTSPLSHIGDIEGIDAFLVTQKILNGQEIEEVPLFSGNAVRGTMRDLGAAKLLGDNKTNLDAFYLLFSGGNIAGAQKNDIELFKKIRNICPFISIFGGGIGIGIMSGKLQISDLLPVCSETSEITNIKSDICWGELTQDRSFTRKDDAKEDLTLSKTCNEEPAEEKKKGQASTQMRYTVETLIPGTRLIGSIVANDLTKNERSALASTLYEFAKYNILGGKSNIGFGKYNGTFTIGKEVIEVKNGEITASDKIKKEIEEYEEFINKFDVKELEECLK